MRKNLKKIMGILFFIVIAYFIQGCTNNQIDVVKIDDLGNCEKLKGIENVDCQLNTRVRVADLGLEDCKEDIECKDLYWMNNWECAKVVDDSRRTACNKQTNISNFCYSLPIELRSQCLTRIN